MRNIGISIPEIRPHLETFGIKVWWANRDLVEDEEVCLERGVSETEKYGRLLRRAFVDDIFINTELLRQGFAWAIASPPDTKYQDYLERMEEEVREAGNGIWTK